jgi:murein DD-endopeptidase MepM/ murein hydrolase activator NlpD
MPTYIYPVQGDSDKGIVTIPQKHSETSSGGDRIDIMVPQGTPVYAMASGTITVRRTGGKYDKNTAYSDSTNTGRCVSILTDDNIYITYMHLSKIEDNVQVGSKVVAGQKIGESGHTGASYNPHLHV